MNNNSYYFSSLPSSFFPVLYALALTKHTQQIIRYSAFLNTESNRYVTELAQFPTVNVTCNLAM